MVTQCWYFVPQNNGVRNFHSILQKCSGPLVSSVRIYVNFSLLILRSMTDDPEPFKFPHTISQTFILMYNFQSSTWQVSKKFPIWSFICVSCSPSMSINPVHHNRVPQSVKSFISHFISQVQTFSQGLGFWTPGICILYSE